MILLPASSFEMGDSSGEPDILVEHLCPFIRLNLMLFILIYEVTVRQFKKFIDDTDYMPSVIVDYWKNTGQKFLKYRQQAFTQ